jgi:hypothetical protein
VWVGGWVGVGGFVHVCPCAAPVGAGDEM